MTDLRSLGGNLAQRLGVAFRSFVATFLVLLASGILLAGASYFFLRDYPLYGTIAAGVAVVESLIAGVVFGGKRAVVTALAHGFRSLGLGRRVVGVIFGRLLGISADQEFGEFGERGGPVLQRLERLPLAEAERGLTATVRQVAAVGGTGWLRSRIERRLLGTVAKVTLARFRREGAERGGVDLVGVQSDLESRIDEMLVARLRSGLNVWTMLVILGLPLTVAVQTYILIVLLHAK